MAKPNYQFEKRQRELEKKRKKEEKRQLKNSPAGDQAGDGDGGEQPAAAANGDAEAPGGS